MLFLVAFPTPPLPHATDPAPQTTLLTPNPAPPCHPVYNNRHFPSAPPFPPCPAPHPAPIIQPPDQLRHPQSTSMVWSNTSPPPLRGVPVITDPHLQRPLGCKLAPPKDDIYDDVNLPAWAGGDDPRLINVQISNAAIEIKNCTRPGEVRCSSVYKAIISIDAGDIKRSAVAPMTVVGQSGDGVGGAEGTGWSGRREGWKPHVGDRVVSRAAAVGLVKRRLGRLSLSRLLWKYLLGGSSQSRTSVDGTAVRGVEGGSTQMLGVRRDGGRMSCSEVSAVAV